MLLCYGYEWRVWLARQLTVALPRHLTSALLFVLGCFDDEFSVLLRLGSRISAFHMPTVSITLRTHVPFRLYFTLYHIISCVIMIQFIDNLLYQTFYKTFRLQCNQRKTWRVRRSIVPQQQVQEAKESPDSVLRPSAQQLGETFQPAEVSQCSG